MISEIVLVLSLIVAVSCDDSCDKVKCNYVPIKHYIELGCKPVHENSECCTSRYQCPDKAQFALDKCHWNGNTYNLKDELPLNVTNALCSGGCFCAEGHPDSGIPAEFICAHIQCANFLGCTRISTQDRCCPKHICDEEEKQKLGTATCVVDGKRYRVGEKMYPASNECYSCICAEHFDNSTIVGNPACREIDCGIGLRNYVDVRYGCIPNYYGTNGCCPIGWRCPRENDVVITSGIRSSLSADPNLQCQFGNLTLNVGDEIKSDHECTKCKCLIPPMAQCLRTPNCTN